ncbi:MAG: hypothetical protein QOK61_02140 [Nitrososphaeraceae archaeon]|nr:hypothetical protein [Nitrososphaeraceae archaeon]
MNTNGFTKKLACFVCKILKKMNDMNFRKPSIAKVEKMGEKMNPII